MRVDHILRTIGSVATAVSMYGIAMAPSMAAELEEGFVIDGSNYERVKDDTFEGHRIDTMLPDSHKKLIVDYGLRVKLAHSKPWDKNERMIALTEKYAPQVRFNPETKRIENYVAGIPFPDLDIQNDEYAGWKLAYNITWSAFIGDLLYWPTVDYVMVGENGYERSITYFISVYNMVGRQSTGDVHVEGDGTIRNYTTIIATAPSDARGIGTFSIRYADGRLDDIYAYIRSVRRFRRLSGGAWYDPIQGTDMLLDQSANGLNIDPSWYKDFRILEKRVMLSPETTTENYASGKGRTYKEQYPLLDLETPPYWNHKDENEVWRPRETYIMEAIPPKEHPHSRRVYYVNTDPYWPLAFAADNYDRAGNLWQICTFSVNRIKTEDGYPGVNEVFMRVVDLKRLHATVIPGGPGRQYNPPGVTSDDFNLEAVRDLVE